MKFRFLAVAIALLLPLTLPRLAAAAQQSVGDALAPIVKKIQVKLSAGAHTEDDLRDELKALDALLAAHQDEKTDDTAEILVLKQAVYVEVLRDATKGLEIARQLKAEFPATTPGRQADAMIASLEKMSAAEEIQRKLAVGTAFPDFKELDTGGTPVSVSGFKGKVLLVDFWATWCPPCLAELPDVVDTYRKYHPRGFEIVGISLDHAGDGAKLAQFTREHEMPWAQIFDGKGWDGKLVQQFGVSGIPNTFLLDGDGRIIAKDLRGEDLTAAVDQAVAAR